MRATRSAELNRAMREAAQATNRTHREHMAALKEPFNSPRLAKALNWFSEQAHLAMRMMARPRQGAKPTPAAGHRALRAVPKPAAATPRIDTTAVYAALNKPLVAPKPAPARARSFAQLAAEVYGYAGGGEGEGLIATSARGGGR